MELPYPIPSSGVEINKNVIFTMGSEFIFLIDSCTYSDIQLFVRHTGIDLLREIESLDSFDFLISNNALMEVMNGPDNVDIDFLLNHIINAEGAGSGKDNRFIVDSNGTPSVVELRMVSQSDMNMILLCQNHPELRLVTNDIGLLRNGQQLLGPNRVFGLPVLIEHLLKSEPDRQSLRNAKEKLTDIWELKPVWP